MFIAVDVVIFVHGEKIQDLQYLNYGKKALKIFSIQSKFFATLSVNFQVPSTEESPLPIEIKFLLNLDFFFLTRKIYNN